MLYKIGTSGTWTGDCCVFPENNVKQAAKPCVSKDVQLSLQKYGKITKDVLLLT